MKSYLRILTLYLKEQKLFTSFVLLVLFIQACIIISFQIAYKEIFDGVADKKSLEFILVWTGVILTAAVLRIVIGLISDYVVSKLTLKIFGKIRTRFFHLLQWLPSEFYLRVQVSDIISHYSHDLQQSEMVTRQFLPLIVRSLFLGCISFATLFYFNWQLTLIALALFPFVLGGALLFIKRARNETTSNLAAGKKLSRLTEETATQHMLIQAFNLQESFLERFTSTLNGYNHQFLKGIFLRTLVGRTSVFGLSLVEIIIFSIGGIMTYHGLMSIGTLFGFFALIWNISGAVSTISDVTPNMIEAGGYMNNLQKFLSEKVDIPSAPDPSKRREKESIAEEKISLSNVSLRHGEHDVLQDISLKILPGQRIGIVGSTGSGKTSLLSLLMGFYSPTEGDIYFDHKEIRALDIGYHRTQIGIVFQHNPLFNQTIRDNIRIGKMDATNEEIFEAAKHAEIHDFILSLPEGYDTLVKEYGSNLSGGQKQRIALARVYLRNPALYLFDEPTSALDPIVENQIYQTILKLCRGKTVVLSTHRLAILKAFDQIYVLEKGKIVERGSHSTLMEQKGVYYNSWQKQHTAFYFEEPELDKEKLGSLPPFRDLDRETLNMLASRFTVEHREEGSLITKNELLNTFYLIARGEVEISSPDMDPLESVRVLEDGDYFGITKNFSNCRPDTRVITRTHCTFLILKDET